MYKKNSTVITRNTNCSNPETDGFFAAYSGCFCFSKRDNFVFTSSSVEGEAFMAMVGARCTGLVGETSMCLVMPALSSARRRIMSAWSKGKWGYCLGSFTGSTRQLPDRFEYFFLNWPSKFLRNIWKLWSKAASKILPVNTSYLWSIIEPVIKDLIRIKTTTTTKLLCHKSAWPSSISNFGPTFRMNVRCFKN